MSHMRKQLNNKKFIRYVTFFLQYYNLHIVTVSEGFCNSRLQRSVG